MSTIHLTPSKEAIELAERIQVEGKINLQDLPEDRVGDELFAYFMFQNSHGRAPTNQMMFNDVLYRIKTSNEILDPLRVFVSDKEYVKIFIKANIGDQYNVPTIAVLRTPDEVDSFDFPDTCCIKPTHASGFVILRKDGEEIDKQEIKQWFSINYYKTTREANYKTLRPKVIIEPLIFDNENTNDYKFFCLDGKIKLIQIDIDRRKNHQRKMFNENWEPQDFSIEFPMTTQTISKPTNFEQMIWVVESLAKNFGFIRIDLYNDTNKILVGEITNCHGNAGESFIPKTGEKKASEIIFGTW